jgi:hypothetical protein
MTAMLSHATIFVITGPPAANIPARRVSGHETSMASLVVSLFASANILIASAAA